MDSAAAQHSPEAWKRSNKGKNAHGTWCRMRSVPFSFNELHYIAEIT